MKPAVSNIKELSTSRNTFQITAGGSNYFISINFVNSEGQLKHINRLEFDKLVFESSYKSPFIIGRLQLINNNEQNNFLNRIGKNTGLEYKRLGSGGEYIHIIIEQQAAHTRCKRVEIVNKIFVSQNLEISSDASNKYLNYYFADIEYASLLLTRAPWSTNDYISPRKQYVTKLGPDEKTIPVSDAIAALLLKFCNRKHSSQSKYKNTHLIELDQYQNRVNWDESSSRIEYTLPNNEPPVVALGNLLSKYISKDHNDLGILRLIGGSFRLNSLTNIFKSASKLTNNKSIFYKENFAAGLRLETDDNRYEYSRRQANDLFKNKDILIPLHISNVDIINKQPDTAANVIVDHSIVSYNIGDKAFKLFNSKGSVHTVTKDFTTYVDTLPDGNKKEANVEKAEFTKPNKKLFFNQETKNDSSDAYGKAILQQKILDVSDKISFNIPGNLNIAGAKFIGIELAGLQVNSYLKNLPGFWFVLENVTSIQEGLFQSKIICSKVDKDIVE